MAIKGTCEICGCTESEACEGGCAWTNDEEILCTRCELALEFAMATLPVLVSLAAKGPNEAVPWEAIEPVHQLALVKSYRLLADGMRDQFFESIGGEVTNAVMELATIASLLYQKLPERMEAADAAGDPVGAVLMELIEQAAERRIVVSGL